MVRDRQNGMVERNGADLQGMRGKRVAPADNRERMLLQESGLIRRYDRDRDYHVKRKGNFVQVRLYDQVRSKNNRNGFYKACMRGQEQKNKQGICKKIDGSPQA